MTTNLQSNRRAFDCENKHTQQKDGPMKEGKTWSKFSLTDRPCSDPQSSSIELITPVLQKPKWAISTMTSVENHDLVGAARDPRGEPLDCAELAERKRVRDGDTGGGCGML
jgi:hypothetical protein